MATKTSWTEAYELRSKLSEITNHLKLFDKISLIFLMCPSPEVGLNLMNSLLQEIRVNERNNIFFKWLVQQKIFKLNDWKTKYLEFLVIIQNYKLAKILGYKKSVSKEKHCSKISSKSTMVSSIRKVLYTLCEGLTRDETSKLISAFSSAHSVNENECQKLGLQYFEYNLLFWSCKGIINLDEGKNINLDALIQVLMQLGYNNFVHDIEILVDKVNGQLLRDRVILQRNTDEPEYYPIIDEKDLGYCVIINQKIFSNPMLTTRWGTGKDVERLIEVFTMFGFSVKVHSDLTYEALIEKLEFYARTVKECHSVFVLIILSHGSENVIFTSDSHAVDMSTIEMVFQAEICPNLIGKPKILVVQSCQGEKWQKLYVKNKEEDEVYSDSAEPPPNSRDSVVMGPQRGDSMIAWSTVQGFASFRDKHNGSWYIQELCNELWKFGDVMDLVEIFTRVNNNLRSKVYDDQFMVPSLLLSLRAKVKFPYRKETETKARRLLLERLIFEKFFREFIEITASKSEFKNERFFLKF